MRSIIESLSVEERRKYDYDLLENKYMEHQSRIVDDKEAINELRHAVDGRKVLLIAPGKSVDTEKEKIQKFIKENNPLIIAVNALNKNYEYDYVIFINSARYEYAKSAHPDIIKNTRKILMSNIKTEAENDEIIINYNTVIKRGWEHFDNSVIVTLRLLNKLDAGDIILSGFDGFKHKYNESYADDNLPTLNPGNKWDELNEEITDMFKELMDSFKDKRKVSFLTDSIYNI